VCARGGLTCTALSRHVASSELLRSRSVSVFALASLSSACTSMISSSYRVRIAWAGPPQPNPASAHAVTRVSQRTRRGEEGVAGREREGGVGANRP
jgi:hypothetical protein